MGGRRWRRCARRGRRLRRRVGRRLGLRGRAARRGRVRRGRARRDARRRTAAAPRTRRRGRDRIAALARRLGRACARLVGRGGSLPVGAEQRAGLRSLCPRRDLARLRRSCCAACRRCSPAHWACALRALAGKAVPGLFPDGGRIARLRNPVGYSNGLSRCRRGGCDRDLAGDVVRPAAWRIAGGLLVHAAALVPLLTQSRAGVGAGLVAVVAWCGYGAAGRGALVAVAAGVPAVLVGVGVHAACARRRRCRARRPSGRRCGVRGAGPFAGAALAMGLVLLLLGRVAVERRRAVVRAG